MRLLYNWYRDIGVEVPDSFGELTLNNYLGVWKHDKKYALSVMIELFSTLGAPVGNLDDIKRHDLLVVEEKGNLYAAIALGGKMAITSNIHHGVRTFFLGDLHRLVMARRMI